jgi:hypothetical protein
LLAQIHEMFHSKFKPSAFNSFLFNGSISLAMLLLPVLPAFSQMGDGHFVYSNDTYLFEFDLIDNGWTIEKTLLINKINGAEETGSGSWFKVNMNGVDPGYNGPEGWYEFSNEICNYTFTLNTNEDSLFLSKECSNGQPALESILTRESDAEIIDAPDPDFVIIDSEVIDEPMDAAAVDFNIADLNEMFVAMVTKAQFDNEFMAGQIQVSGPTFLVKYDELTGEASGVTETEGLAFTVKMTSWGPDDDPIYPTLELTDKGLSIFPQAPGEAYSWAIRYSGTGFFELYEPYSDVVFYILAPLAGD